MLVSVSGISRMMCPTIPVAQQCDESTNYYHTVGGLAGYADGANITRSYFIGSVAGSDSVGGLAGFPEGVISLIVTLLVRLCVIHK